MKLNALENVNISCPHCGETIACEIDTSTAKQQYIEDCHVCCAPIAFEINIDAHTNQLEVITRKDNE